MLFVPSRLPHTLNYSYGGGFGSRDYRQSFGGGGQFNRNGPSGGRSGPSHYGSGGSTGGGYGAYNGSAQLPHYPGSYRSGNQGGNYSTDWWGN